MNYSVKTYFAIVLGCVGLVAGVILGRKLYHLIFEKSFEDEIDSHDLIREEEDDFQDDPENDPEPEAPVHPSPPRVHVPIEPPPKEDLGGAVIEEEVPLTEFEKNVTVTDSPNGADEEAEDKAEKAALGIKDVPKPEMGADN